VSGGARRNADAALIAALAAGRTVETAAREAGVSVATAHRRLADGGFRAQVDAARRETVTRALGIVAEGATAAGATLRLLLGAESESVRLGAARALLEHAVRGLETLDIEARLTALEERLQTKEARRWG
jgi:hypothetical protein